MYTKLKQLLNEKLQEEKVEGKMEIRFLLFQPFRDSNRGKGQIRENAEDTEGNCEKISRIHEKNQKGPAATD